MAWRYPPPGGFAGFAQETPAQQAQFGRAAGSGGGTPRRRKAKKAAPKRRKRRSTAKAGKGSAAMKRKMARLRRMRRK